MFNFFNKKEDKWEDGFDDRCSALCDILAERHGLTRVIVVDIMKETSRFMRREVTGK